MATLSSLLRSLGYLLFIVCTNKVIPLALADSDLRSTSSSIEAITGSSLDFVVSGAGDRLQGLMITSLGGPAATGSETPTGRGEERSEDDGEGHAAGGSAGFVVVEARRPVSNILQNNQTAVRVTLSRYGGGNTMKRAHRRVSGGYTAVDT